MIVHEVNNPTCVLNEAKQDKGVGVGQITPDIEVRFVKMRTFVHLFILFFEYLFE